MSYGLMFLRHHSGCYATNGCWPRRAEAGNESGDKGGWSLLCHFAGHHAVLSGHEQKSLPCPLKKLLNLKLSGKWTERKPKKDVNSFYWTTHAAHPFKLMFVFYQPYFQAIYLSFIQQINGCLPCAVHCSKHHPFPNIINCHFSE